MKRDYPLDCVAVWDGNWLNEALFHCMNNQQRSFQARCSAIYTCSRPNGLYAEVTLGPVPDEVH